MDPHETYERLRTLTSPVVAVTSRRGTKRNGMVSDGAVRASIVPDMPRLGVFIHKFNYSHDMIFETGAFGVHILHTGQAELVQRLGFVSGRDRDKLDGVAHRLGAATGVPILEDCWAWFECAVCNVMDTGSSTFFMGDVLDSGAGTGGDVLEPAVLRSMLPPDLVDEYQGKLEAAQAAARTLSNTIRTVYSRK